MPPDIEAADRFRLAPAEFKPNPGGGDCDVTAVITTDSVNDENEVVLPGGCDLSRQLKAPLPLLVCHDWQRPTAFYPYPVGCLQYVKVLAHGIEVGIKFARSTVWGRETKGLVEEGILRGLSVGMLVQEQSAMTAAEAASRPDWADAWKRLRGKIHVIRRWKLVEVSVAPVAANADALFSTMKAKGLRLPSWVVVPKALAPARRPSLPVLTGRTDRQHHAEQIKQLTHVAGQVRGARRPEAGVESHE